MVIRAVGAGATADDDTWTNAALQIGTADYAPWPCARLGGAEPPGGCDTREGPWLFIEQRALDRDVSLAESGVDGLIEVGVEGAEAFWEPIDGAGEHAGSFTMVVGRTLFHVQSDGEDAPTRGELLGLIRSLAEQAR